MLFGRRSWDKPPQRRPAVLLASAGTPFSGAAVRRACELAAGEPVAVLTILKVYGSTFGLPNPGLMPTRRERDEQYAIVRRAIAGVERRGGTADGQIAATRSAGRTIAKVARRAPGPLRGDGRLRPERGAPRHRGRDNRHRAPPAGRRSQRSSWSDQAQRIS